MANILFLQLHLLLWQRGEYPLSAHASLQLHRPPQSTGTEIKQKKKKRERKEYASMIHAMKSDVISKIPKNPYHTTNPVKKQ